MLRRSAVLVLMTMVLLMSSEAFPLCGSGSSPQFCIDTTTGLPAGAALSATVTEEGHVALHWTVPSLAGVSCIDIQRALCHAGPFDAVNNQPLAPSLSGIFVDVTVWPGAEFWYRLSAVSAGGEAEVLAGPAFVRTGGVLSFALERVSPNPASSNAEIVVELAEDCESVRLGVYDVSGCLVRLLANGPRMSGRHTDHWDGRDTRGRLVSAGVYLIRADAGSWTGVGKVVVVR
jgi:hypothetical protein